jgi:hypothetical protein
MFLSTGRIPGKSRFSQNLPKCRERLRKISIFQKFAYV